MRLFSVSAFLALAAMAPTLAIGDDHQIAKNILEKLSVQKEAGKLTGFNVQLQVDEGVVRLKGFVSEADQEDLVIDIARREPGVKKVMEAVELIKANPSIQQPKSADMPSPTALAQPDSLRKQMGPANVAGESETLQTASYNDDTSGVTQFQPVSVKQVALHETVGASNESSVTPSPASPVAPRDV
ncbi:MAG: BON domain-containing protein, partial [bacterium]|nr:BON domain-containing protein [bacterium]